MCAVNRVSSEPPAHPACARYAVQACPFLANPRMRRNENDLPDERIDAAGVHFARNPGVTVLWSSLYASRPFDVLIGEPGVLFELGAPERVEWWTPGRWRPAPSARRRWSSASCADATREALMQAAARALGWNIMRAGDSWPRGRASTWGADDRRTRLRHAVPAGAAPRRRGHGEAGGGGAAGVPDGVRIRAGRFVLLHHLQACGVGRRLGCDNTDLQLRYSAGMMDSAIMLANEAGYDEAALAAGAVRGVAR